MAGDRHRRAHADLRADRLGQDARRVPVGARPARRRADAPDRTRLVYVSPLKALSYDVEKNLRAPLRGIGADVKVGDPHRRHAAEGAARHGPAPAGHPDHHARVAVPDAHQPGAGDLRRHRAGDRRRDPRGRADQARRAPRAHARAARRAGRDATSSGSACRATQNPLEEVGRFLVGPKRDVHDHRHRRAQAAGPEDPRAGRVDGRARADATLDLDPFAGQEATRKSIWPAIYPEILELVREHRSTIVFVNNRARRSGSRCG